jgi:hypothetical protein
MMIRTDLPVLLVGGMVVAAIAVWALLARRRPATASAAEVCRSFGLDPTRYRVPGSDVGGFAVPFSIEADGLMGRPDAVFMSRDNSEVVVGEVKSRHHQGRITRYERFQITLYLGSGRAQLRTDAVRGLIRYRDRVVAAPFQEQAYRHLLSLRPECLRVRAAA